MFYCWRSGSTNHYGRLILQFLSQTNLAIINSGTQTTYQKGNKGSILTYCLLTTHVKVRLSVRCSTCTQTVITWYHCWSFVRRNRIPQWKIFSKTKMETKRVRYWHFRCDLECGKGTNRSCRHLVSAVQKELVVASDATMRRTKYHNKRRPLYWWSDEISKLRKLWHSDRRHLHHNQGSKNVNRSREEFKSHKKRLKSANTHGKRSCFEKLWEDANIDP